MAGNMHVGPENCISSETKAVFCSSMAVVDVAQHAWSERGRDDGASRVKKNTICNAEFFTKVPECLELIVWELLSRWPTVEGVMLQQVHVRA